MMITSPSNKIKSVIEQTIHEVTNMIMDEVPSVSSVSIRSTEASMGISREDPLSDILEHDFELVINNHAMIVETDGSLESNALIHDGTLDIQSLAQKVSIHELRSRLRGLEPQQITYEVGLSMRLKIFGLSPQ